MNIEKELNKIGIFPTNIINYEEKKEIAKDISNKLTKKFNILSCSYNEIYIRLLNCNVYYASIDKKFGGAIYFYKNNSIYIDKDSNIKEIYEDIIHEIIHYLQNFNKINKKENRAGICKFNDFGIFALGINEALVQYITAKIQDSHFYRINNETISIYTNSLKNYKYLTSLINQVIFLLGEEKAVKSSLESTDEFEDELFNTFEENTNKIIKNFDFILNENNKKNIDKDKIINLYMETQEIIYKTYFTKICKRINKIKEIDEQVDKLKEYENIMGRFLNNEQKNKEFKNFKSEIEGKFLKKYVELNKNDNSLIIVYKNRINNLWQKVVRFIDKKFLKEK